MRGETSVTLSRRFVSALLATLVWMSLASGIYASVVGPLAGGVILTMAGLIILGFWVSGSLTKRLMDRPVPRASLYFLALVLVGVMALELASLFTSEPSITFRFIGQIVNRVVLLILAVLTLWQGLAKARART